MTVIMCFPAIASFIKVNDISGRLNCVRKLVFSESPSSITLVSKIPGFTERVRV